MVGGGSLRGGSGNSVWLSRCLGERFPLAGPWVSPASGTPNLPWCGVAVAERGHTVQDSRSIANLRRLAGHVLARYGSIDAFCAQLYLLLDYPTTELPAATGPYERDR